MNIQPLLDFLTPIVVPDWGALVSLIPIGLALLVVLWLLLTLRAFAGAGPTRRAPARVKPIPPASVHMPGGSAAPILAAFGAFSVFASVIIGGPVIIVGVTILIVTLALWGREAMREYEHIEPISSLPAVIHEGPPPGVHMPGPSIRPFLGALGTGVLFGGIVIGGFVFLLALIFFIWTLVGWLTDAKAEYGKVEEADRTGHLENIPARAWPKAILQLFVIAFVVVAVAQSGVVSKIGANVAGPGGSGGPGASGGPGGSTADATVVAKDVAFDTHALSVTGGKSFTVAFDNQDAGVPHNIEIKDASGAVVQDQATITGVAQTTYTFNALKPGTYTFICKVHPIPSMTGTLTVK